MSQPAALDTLLVANGRVRWAGSIGSVERKTPAWNLDELRGRVVELIGEGPTAVLTVATGLVFDAQCSGEPVAWLWEGGLGQHGVHVYPPDVAAAGVDLANLAFVRLADTAGLLRAVDVLVRSGAFGLTVVDCAGLLDQTSPIAVPLGAQARLVGLAKQHDATVLWLSRDGSGNRSGARALGSFASLRAVCARRRIDDGVFECTVEVVKDKRRGQGWRHAFEPRDGTLGLR